MEKIEIGKIVNTFGLKGELKVLPNPNCEKYFENLQNFEISKFDEEFVCEKVSTKQDKFVKLKIKDFDDINDVTKFNNHSIYVKTFEKPELEENEFLVEDLIDCEIFLDGKNIAKIVDVENFGATDIFVLEYNGKEARIPFVEDFFDKLDTKNKKITASMHFFEGLTE